MKKFPFERSVYTQCIPNPKKPNEFITVQIVKRLLEYKYKELHEAKDEVRQRVKYILKSK